MVHGIPNTPVASTSTQASPCPTSPSQVTAPGPARRHVPHRRAALQRPPASTPILYKPVPSVSSGEDASIVADLTASGSPTLSLFADPTTSVPVGDTRVIVRHVAEAPGVDVYAGTSKVVTDLTNPNQAALVIPAGKVPVSVDVTGTTTTVIGPATFHFLAGRTTVVYAIGSAAGKTLTVAVQKYHVPQAAAPAERTVVHGIPNLPVDVYVNGKLPCRTSPLARWPGLWPCPPARTLLPSGLRGRQPRRLPSCPRASRSLQARTPASWPT